MPPGPLASLASELNLSASLCPSSPWPLSLPPCRWPPPPALPSCFSSGLISYLWRPRAGYPPSSQPLPPAASPPFTENQVTSSPWHQFPTGLPARAPPPPHPSSPPSPPRAGHGLLPWRAPRASQASRLENSIPRPGPRLRRAGPQTSQAARTRRHPFLSIIHGADRLTEQAGFSPVPSCSFSPLPSRPLPREVAVQPVDSSFRDAALTSARAARKARTEL